MSKVNLNIIVEHKPDGKVLPRTILWPDGRRFEIDKILNVRKAPALKEGGIGARYMYGICGQEGTFLRYEGFGLWRYEENGGYEIANYFF